MRDGADHIKVAIWQGSPKRGNVMQNLERLAAIAAEAAERDADVLIFPEGYLTASQGMPNARAIARSINDDMDAELARIARSNGVALMVGAHEEEAGSLYSTAFFYCPHWGCIGTYRKRTLMEEWEKAILTRGQQSLALDYRGWKFGMLIGSDMDFPELVREVAHEGIDALLIAASRSDEQQGVTDMMLPVRAVENQIYLLYANRAGQQSGTTFSGASRIVGPDGKLLGQLPDEATDMLITTLSKSEIGRSRAEFCYLEEARALRAPVDMG